MDGGDDLISVLPDSVLGEIVTRLPTADAAHVQVLSTRWRDMWHSSPLNLDLHAADYLRDSYKRLVSTILEAHPGPGRRLKVEWRHDDGLYNRWLHNPALNGLEELEIEAGRVSNRVQMRPLPEQAVFRFAPTLRLLKIGFHSFPTAMAMAALLRFPHLELISLCCVDISEGTLQGLLAGCPVLKTLVLDDLCTGVATVRINSPTITSFAIATVASGYYYRRHDVIVTTSRVIIEDAPLLEKLVPFRRAATPEPFQLLVLSAPRLRVLGSLSSIIHKFEIGAGGGTVFKSTTQRVYRVKPGEIMVEKRWLMQTVMLAMTIRTVKILALEDVGSVDVVINYLRCFPCLEKLYTSRHHQDSEVLQAMIKEILLSALSIV